MTQLKNYEQNTNLIDCVKLGIIIVDEQGLVVRGNQIACQLLNVEKMNGRSLEHFIPLLNLENLHRIMIQNTCNTIEINNRRIQLQAQQIPLRHDRVEVLLFLMDITTIEFMVRDFNELQLGKEDDRSNLTYENDDLMDIREAVSRTEMDLIQKAFNRYGNVREAAKALGIDASTFVRKRNKYEKLGMLRDNLG